ncbi:MAG: ribosome small subunit-dependent GTPase A [Clostridiales bacterium]|nr:ribosome small subunit-dependent GTPase A [Clostridiales bacterium]
MTGLVYKKVANNFWVKTLAQDFCCIARGNLKADGVFVGDSVEIDTSNNPVTIEKINKRKNIFVRPPLANLDALVIVIAEVPAPDFMIVDKLILFSLCYGVEPIIVVNKIDLNKGLCEKVKKVYENVVENIIFTNAKTGEGLDNLKQALKGKLSAFAGQSAVGKSALVNSILKKHASQVGELSIKIERGKNTTRHCEIFFEDDIYITDTAGFTSLDEKLLPIAYYELPYYYPDFVKVMEGCKYKSCVHFNEKQEECAVKRAVLDGLIDKDRFLRYKEIYKILNQKWVRTHG